MEVALTRDFAIRRLNRCERAAMARANGPRRLWIYGGAGFGGLVAGGLLALLSDAVPGRPISASATTAPAIRSSAVISGPPSTLGVLEASTTVPPQPDLPGWLAFVRVEASPGTTTTVPVTTTPAPVGPITYVVQPGDTLTGIAHWFELHGYRDLYETNRDVIGADPNLIFPGQTITIGPGVVHMGAAPP